MDRTAFGFRARKNCEEMPVITAWLVRSNLNDPRKIHQFHPSKEATTRRKLAKKCKELASELKRYDPTAADDLVAAGEGLLIDADTLAEQAKRIKRHPPHAETQHVLLAMEQIHQHTCRWHDLELTTMLQLVGLNQYTPGRLRVLRTETR